MERTCREGAHKVQLVELLECKDLYDWCQRFAPSSGNFRLFLFVVVSSKPLLARRPYPSIGVANVSEPALYSSPAFLALSRFIPATKMLFCFAYQSCQSHASLRSNLLAITDPFTSLFALANRVCLSLASTSISQHVSRTDVPRWPFVSSVRSAIAPLILHRKSIDFGWHLFDDKCNILWHAAGCIATAQCKIPPAHDTRLRRQS